MSLLDVLGQEVIRVELLGIGAPNIRSTMQRVEIDEQSDSSRNFMIT
jgi:hypothetical protein